MSSVHYSPCPIFPGEVEDYYCTTCQTPCSGLSLLVGPHTGHNRLPLLQAAQYLPSSLNREAHTLVLQIQQEYVRPKSAHCATLHASLHHLQQERVRKRQELEEIQRELNILDEKIEILTQECATAVCHWSHRRNNFAGQVRRLLNGANALAKTVGLNENNNNNNNKSFSKRRHVGKDEIIDCTISTTIPVFPPQTLRAIERELEEVQKVLMQPLQWLEELEIEEEQQWQRKEVRPVGSEDAVLREKAEECSWKQCGIRDNFSYTKERNNKSSSTNGGNNNNNNNNSSKVIPSDSKAVLEHFLAGQMEEKLQQSSSKTDNYIITSCHEKEEEEYSDNNEEFDDSLSNCETINKDYTTVERQRWRNDVKRRERLLHDGLNRCLISKSPQKKKTITRVGLETISGIIGSEETDVNDISSSSSIGSVNEAVAHLLRRTVRR